VAAPVLLLLLAAATVTLVVRDEGTATALEVRDADNVTITLPDVSQVENPADGFALGESAIVMVGEAGSITIDDVTLGSGAVVRVRDGRLVTDIVVTAPGPPDYLDESDAPTPTVTAPTTSAPTAPTTAVLPTPVPLIRPPPRSAPSIGPLRRVGAIVRARVDPRKNETTWHRPATLRSLSESTVVMARFVWCGRQPDSTRPGLCMCFDPPMVRRRSTRRRPSLSQSGRAGN